MRLAVLKLAVGKKYPQAAVFFWNSTTPYKSGVLAYIIPHLYVVKNHLIESVLHWDFWWTGLDRACLPLPVVSRYRHRLGYHILAWTAAALTIYMGIFYCSVVFAHSSCLPNLYSSTIILERLVSAAMYRVRVHLERLEKISQFIWWLLLLLRLQ